MTSLRLSNLAPTWGSLLFPSQNQRWRSDALLEIQITPVRRPQVAPQLDATIYVRNAITNAEHVLVFTESLQLFDSAGDCIQFHYEPNVIAGDSDVSEIDYTAHDSLTTRRL